MPQTLTIRQPDDWHLHLRDGASLPQTVAASARSFARAIVMPNLQPPVTDLDAALAYRQRILAALPQGNDFRPLMTLYLTDTTGPGTILAAADSGAVFGVKLYPAGATTHSDAGVTDLARCTPALEAMAEAGLPLLVHGEVTSPEVDIFDREREFLERVLAPLLERHPRLRVVLEHVTSRAGVEFVRQGPERLGATLTAHHLLINRNHLLAGGIRPHHYCLPVAKRERDREALLEAAVSGHPRFFLGTDSAPHSRAAKEAVCGCAGIYTAPLALELYARAFEQAGALERLDDFAGRFGAEFYGLPLNSARVTLEQESWQVPEAYPLGAETVRPMAAGETLEWRLRGV